MISISRALKKRVAKGILHLIYQVDGDLLREALNCAAAGEDTTQERYIRDQLAELTAR
jgi:hypothetical protein